MRGGILIGARGGVAPAVRDREEEPGGRHLATSRAGDWRAMWRQTVRLAWLKRHHAAARLDVYWPAQLTQAALLAYKTSRRRMGRKNMAENVCWDCERRGHGVGGRVVTLLGRTKTVIDGGMAAMALANKSFHPPWRMSSPGAKLFPIRWRGDNSSRRCLGVSS